MPDQPLTPTEIGRELAALRLRHVPRMSAADAGSRVGVSQSTVTRWESGRFLPDDGKLRALCQVYGADQDTEDRLAAGIAARSERPAGVRLARPEDAADRQAQWGNLERDSVRVLAAGVTAIPGLLQTEAYMRAVVTAGGRLSGDRLEDWVVNRLWRQRILTESGREFRLVVCPGALTWGAGSHELMADQIQALILASRLPSVTLGVIPPGRPVDVFPLHNFDVFESEEGARTAVVGTLAGTAVLEQRTDVAKHVTLMERLEALASRGDQVRSELRRVAALYE